MTHALFDVNGSGFHAVASTSAGFAGLAERLQHERPDAVVRVIRGSHSRTAPDFFTEIAAALEFPSYFGRNWNAFNDCILDLSWLRGSAYVLLFADADQLLDEAHPDNLAAFAELLQGAHNAWQPSPEAAPGVQPVPFHAVFHALPRAFDLLTTRLLAVGFTLDPDWPGETLLD